MPDWLFQVVGIVAAGAGVYAAIRADLAYIRARADGAHESAGRAHMRIDAFFDQRGKA